MEEAPRRDLGSLRRYELIGGLIYLPIFFFAADRIAIWIALLAGVTEDHPNAFALVNLIYQGLNLAVLGGIFLRYLADQYGRLPARGSNLLGDIGLGFLLRLGLSWSASIAISILLTVFDLDYTNVNQDAVESIAAMSPVIAVVMACVMAPIAEELVFRGLIFCGLYRRSRIWAYAVSMLAFSLCHVLGAILYQSPILSLANVIVYLPAGFALAWTYERSGSIWGAIFLHAANNALSLLLLGMNLSSGFIVL